MKIGNYPAFPCEAQGDRSVPQEHDYIQVGIHAAKFPGLTIRDWFACQALAGLLASPFDGPAGAFESQTAHFAGAAYQYADAMLAERAKVGPA
ncbi:hypothetical protein [Sphingobium sp. AntQ-1]|uniref:hypothetical protein n=1 Tax=Sphingobium sp. AntQ-1 TaxID=2930091 RepID=UPI00234F6B08|nr:hypothetical protein [Sphingobium sp. AntQ-1]